MIRIGKPYLSSVDGSNRTRLCSVVLFDNEPREIYYEVNRQFSEYLCTERADAFLLGLLPYAMVLGLDIDVEGEISERLYFQLSGLFIPALASYTKYFKRIDISCSLNHDTLPTAGAIGTGFSGGVDSFYTICNNMNNSTPNYNLTHLSFVNVGA